MPDVDIIERAAKPGWHRVARMYAGGASPAEMCGAILKALTRSLREGGGLPGLVDLCGIFQKVCTGDLSALVAFDQVRSVERQHSGHAHTKVAAREVTNLIREVAQGSPSTIEPTLTVAEHVCSALVGYYHWGQVRLDLVGQGSSDNAEALGEEIACKAALAPYVRELAGRLVRDPTGKSLRAPSVRRPNPGSTASLLNEPIA